MSVISSLPPYPSTASVSALSPAQRSALHETILTTVSQTLSLPPEKRDNKSSLAFLESYARNVAREELQLLIWGVQDSKQREKAQSEGKKLKGKVLSLAQKLVISRNPDARPSLQVLLDLCVVFAAYPSRVRSLLSSALETAPQLVRNVSEEAAPAFITLLSPGHSGGLYGLRKTAHILECFLRCSPEEFIEPFASTKQFVVTLARAYDEGLASIARSYGGTANLTANAQTHPDRLDDWELLYLQTKRSLLDSFHILLSSLLASVSPSASPSLMMNALDALSALVQLSSDAPAGSGPDRIPFIDRPLLTDYLRTQSQQLSRTLISLIHTNDKQWDTLESSIRALEVSNENGDSAPKPEMIKLLLRSSGMPRLQPGETLTIIESQAPSASSAMSKGKERAAPEESDLDLDLKVTQVLDILSDQDPSYVRQLLKGGRSVETVVEGLLEGSLPPPEELLQPEPSQEVDLPPVEDFEKYVAERRNIFDEERLDEAKVWVGKNRDETGLIKDPYLAQMKADILRRVEEMSSDEEDESHGVNVGIDDEDLDAVGVKVGGEDDDGEGSSSTDGEDEGKQPPVDPQAIVERAYMRDPGLFERDAKTRRSDGRARLKTETGWSDEQIEGWRIMLERDPKGKERLQRKYEFSGNRAEMPPVASTSGASGSGGNRGRGGNRRGGGRGGGRGRARGRGDGGGGPGGGSGDAARDRARKERRGNAQRKRGHDKKMARGGL
ncbi:hypothetical protein OE88DRAFT_1809910 [Heliocybe sulcata]|uniref:CUE domain-containing protein n=1 Tax=Heliocybe sulcata TaxID=5364 RepID=A0A5C3MVN6_9AGAM|nr:hypothetical protein OE88DRAFT_1809910 [Heliocybe sulcata]